MKRLLITMTALAMCLFSEAQITDVEKYDIIPDEFEEVFNDHVKTNVAKLINTANGQYLGQVDDRGNLYGYGSYFANDGGQVIGQFKGGQQIFGMRLGQREVSIGTKNFYACYSLETGKLDFVYRDNTKQLANTEACEQYRFESLTYQNGERYIGETLNGKRHGYGIYYYMNGNYWYGQYQNGTRNGFGAMFTTEGKIFIGRWVNGEISKEEKKSQGITIKDIINQ